MDYAVSNILKTSAAYIIRRKDGKKQGQILKRNSDRRMNIHNIREKNREITNEREGGRDKQVSFLNHHSRRTYKHTGAPNMQSKKIRKKIPPTFTDMTQLFVKG